jgi:peptidoglycan-N-acetylglucosamine deacetylase
MINFFQKIFILFCPFYLAAVDIAITIDDYPMGDSILFSDKKRTEAILEACEKHSCKAAFFCIGNTCNNINLLLQVDEKGHFLSNHSMNHLHLSSQSLEEFEKEVKEVDNILMPYKNKKKWYRYPFLDYGNKVLIGGSDKKLLQSLQILKNLGYTEGYVSINTFDWYINTLLSEAIERGDSVDYLSLKNIYIQLLKSWCEYYIDLYERNFSQKITHTLLLHANDLNALFLKDILEMIKDSGWNIVSPEKAFSDTSWRVAIFKNPSVIINKPTTLNFSEIDKLIINKKVFTK